MADYVGQNTPVGKPDNQTLQQILQFVQSSGMIQDPNTQHIDNFMQQNQQSRQNVEGAYQNLQAGQKPGKVEKYAGYAAAGAFLFDSIFGNKDVKEGLGDQVDRTAEVFTDYRKGKSKKNRQSFMDAINKENTFDKYNQLDFSASLQKENALGRVQAQRLNSAKEIFSQEQVNKRAKDQQDFSRESRQNMNPKQQLEYDDKVSANKVLGSDKPVDEWTSAERRIVQMVYPGMDLKDSHELFQEVYEKAQVSAKDEIKDEIKFFRESAEHEFMNLEQRAAKIDGIRTYFIDRAMEKIAASPRYRGLMPEVTKTDTANLEPNISDVLNNLQGGDTRDAKGFLAGEHTMESEAKLQQYYRDYLFSQMFGENTSNKRAERILAEKASAEKAKLDAQAISIAAGGFSGSPSQLSIPQR